MPRTDGGKRRGDLRVQLPEQSRDSEDSGRQSHAHLRPRLHSGWECGIVLRVHGHIHCRLDPADRLLHVLVSSIA